MKRTRVVLIRYDIGLGEAIASRVTRAGVSIACGTARQDGLRLLYEVRPDIILMQLAANSDETWETLTQFRLFTQAPALILAAAPSPEDLTRGAALRVLGFIDPANLDELVARLVEIKRTIRAAKATKTRVAHHHI